MTERCIVKIRDADFDINGITKKRCDIVIGNDSARGKMITFTLKDDLDESPSAFLYEGVHYMVDKRNESYFEAIAINFVKVK
ncbi:MAG: hypothetical protein KAS66_00335 [Candidatus Omnitrophica bacterium]|nr:hypothetical protein [Candidatus Omnitrophota bacterium]